MFRVIFLVATVGTAVAFLGHLVVFGARKTAIDPSKPKLHRFSMWERLVHWATTASFFVLAVTGAIASVGYQERMDGWLWVIHIAAAPVFMVGLLATMLTWAADGRFIRADWDWVKRFGGYLWGDGHAPAGRFNCGQKGFFWAVGVLGFISVASGLLLVMPVLGEESRPWIFLAHRYGTLAYIMAAISHMYLATLANPGTLNSMIVGYVHEDWAKHHHPIWEKNAPR